MVVRVLGLRPRSEGDRALHQLQIKRDPKRRQSYVENGITHLLLSFSGPDYVL